MPQTEFIAQLHQIGCIQFGEFTLVSGKQSPIYIDLRLMMAKPPLLKEAAKVYAELLHPLSFDHLAAVPYAALTIGTAVALETNQPLIYPRKETKDHGTGRVIEGIYSAGDKAVIIEDLVTRGGSSLKAIEKLKAGGLQVSDVVVLIDRQEGGREVLSEMGYHLHAAFKLTEILQILYQQNRISRQEMSAVQNYLGSLRDGNS